MKEKIIYEHKYTERKGCNKTVVRVRLGSVRCKTVSGTQQLTGKKYFHTWGTMRN